MLWNLKMQLVHFENALSQHFGRIRLLFYESTSDREVMSNIAQHEPLPEPDRNLVERAIVEVLEIARHNGITPADLIQMINSGMGITDLLNAIDMSTSAAGAPDRDVC
jgi:hypothetical protein